VQSENRSIGAALSGGGAWSLAQLGVLEALADEGIVVDRVAGTSAGSVMGAILAAGRAREFVCAMAEITWRRMLGFFRIARGGGSVLDFQSAIDFLAGFLPDEIESLDLPYAAVATDLITGDEVITQSGPVVDAIAASCSIPGVFPPFRNGGGWLCDGALVNPMPVGVARRLGARFVLAVDTISDGGMAAAFAAMRHVRLVCALRARLAPIGFRRSRSSGSNECAPESLDVLTVLQSAERVLARAAESRAVEPPDFRIEVPVAGFRPFDFHRTIELVELGRSTARRSLRELRSALDADPRCVALH
jgi:NTE family protein